MNQSRGIVVKQVIQYNQQTQGKGDQGVFPFPPVTVYKGHNGYRHEDEDKRYYPEKTHPQAM